MPLTGIKGPLFRRKRRIGRRLENRYGRVVRPCGHPRGGCGHVDGPGIRAASRRNAEPGRGGGRDPLEGRTRASRVTGTSGA